MKVTGCDAHTVLCLHRDCNANKRDTQHRQAASGRLCSHLQGTVCRDDEELSLQSGIFIRVDLRRLLILMCSSSSMVGGHQRTHL